MNINTTGTNTTKQCITFLSMRRIFEVLEKCGVNQLIATNSIERYSANDNRHGVILNVQKGSEETTTSIIIDVKLGQPTTEQVFDMGYGRGQQCSQRIIIYTDDENKSDLDNPTADEIAVSAVISQMNRYSLDIRLFKISEEGVISKCCDIDTFDEDQEVPLSPKDLPSPIRYRFEEFWSIYFDSNSGDTYYQPWKIFSDEIRQTSEWGFLIYIHSKRLLAEMPIYWDNDGIKMVMKRMHGDNTLLYLWKMKEKELLQKFNNVALNCTPGLDHEIIFKYAQRPVTWLLNASHKEKIDFAKILFDYSFEIKDYLEDVLDSI